PRVTHLRPKKPKISMAVFRAGGPSRTRTGTACRPRDFKSRASTYSAKGPAGQRATEIAAGLRVAKHRLSAADTLQGRKRALVIGAVHAAYARLLPWAFAPLTARRPGSPVPRS